jgi:hypothetical protein
MAAKAPYMPDAEVKFDLWLDNFSTLLSDEPLRYGLAAEEAAVIAETRAEWKAAYQLDRFPSMKNRVSVAAKLAARDMAERTARHYAQRIANNTEIPPGDKVALGLNPRNSERERIKPPARGPLLAVKKVDHLSVTLVYSRRGDGVTSRAKPPGVTGLLLFYTTAAEPVRQPSELPFKMIATKSPIHIRFDAAEGNRTAYFAARWAVPNGGVSPWSPIVSFTVPVGG